MRVDFYHLTRDPVAAVLPAIATRVLDSGNRLLVVGEPRALLDRLSDRLWDAGPGSYLAHDHADAPMPEAQPILLAASAEPINGARCVALADGMWRDEALAFERALLFFDESSIDGARSAWRSLAGRDGCERHYWRQEGGRWLEGP